MNMYPARGRRKAAAVSCTALLSFVIAGPFACRSPRPGDDGGVSVLQQIQPQPVRIGAAKIDIRVANSSGQLVKGATITVEADMSHPGMSPVFAKASEQRSGNYVASLNFNMAGDWVVLTHIQLPGGRKIERQMDVRGVRPN
jgi:hypothetical protein